MGVYLQVTPCPPQHRCSSLAEVVQYFVESSKGSLQPLHREYSSRLGGLGGGLWGGLREGPRAQQGLGGSGSCRTVVAAVMGGGGHLGAGSLGTAGELPECWGAAEWYWEGQRCWGVTGWHWRSWGGGGRTCQGQAESL